MTRSNTVRVFADITKVDEQQRLVYGYASTTSLDSQGEKISKAALEKALPEYMQWANIREMHGKSAAGTAESLEVDDKGAYLCAKIVDDNAWKKVVEKVYKGFSIGGKLISKVDDEITALKINEISLVDRPANPECLIELYKADDIDVDSEVDVEQKEDEKQTPAEENKPEETKADAEKSDQSNDVEKGMYGVATLACLLDQLNAIQQNSVWERDMEGDASPIPDTLKNIVRQLGEALKAMVTEEVDEIVNDPKEDAIATDGDSIKMSATADDVKKSGARNSKSDMAKVQGMHDMSLELGAACKAEKAEHDSDIQKIDQLNEEIKKFSQENETLRKQVEELSKTVLPAKGVQKVVAVSKEQDTGGMVDTQAEEIKTPEQAIKKIHGQGPSFVIGQ